jgi:hypothetical protein
LTHLELIGIEESLSSKRSRNLEPATSDLLSPSWTKINLGGAVISNKIALGSAIQAAHTTCRLLGLLTNSILSKSIINITAVKRYMISILEIYHRLWKSVTIASGTSCEPKFLLSDLIGRFFCGLRDLALHMSHFHEQISGQHKLLLLWGECVLQLVNASVVNSLESRADDIKLVLDLTVELSPQIPGLSLAVLESLQPTTKAFPGHNTVQSSILSRMQVSGTTVRIVS